MAKVNPLDKTESSKDKTDDQKLWQLCDDWSDELGITSELKEILKKPFSDSALAKSVTLAIENGNFLKAEIVYSSWYSPNPFITKHEEEEFDAPIDALISAVDDRTPIDNPKFGVSKASHRAEMDLLNRLFSRMISDAKAQGLSLDTPLTKDKETPLHLAANCFFTHGVQTLLQAGAEPSIYDDKGYLPIHRACERLNDSTVSLLLAYHSQTGPTKPSPGKAAKTLTQIMDETRPSPPARLNQFTFVGTHAQARRIRTMLSGIPKRSSMTKSHGDFKDFTPYQRAGFSSRFEGEDSTGQSPSRHASRVNAKRSKNTPH
jgi:hypothetical protein